MNSADWERYYEGQTRGRTVIPFPNRRWNPTEHQQTMDEMYPYRSIPSVDSYKPKTSAQVSTKNYPNNFKEYTTVRELIKKKLELEFNLSIKLRKSWKLEKKKEKAKQEYLRAVKDNKNVEEKKNKKVNAEKEYKAANRALSNVIGSAELKETELNNIFITDNEYRQAATNNPLVQEIMEDIMEEKSSSYSSGGYKSKSVKRVVKRPVKKVVKPFSNRSTKKPIKRPTKTVAKPVKRA